MTLLEPTIAPLAAEIVVLPSAYVLRRLQLTSPVADTVATVGALEVHATALVMFRGAPFEYVPVPVAVICSVPPFGISQFSPDECGVTVIDCSTGA